MRFQVGTGQERKLWHHPWLPGGTILDRESERFRYTAFFDLPPDRVHLLGSFSHISVLGRSHPIAFR